METKGRLPGLFRLTDSCQFEYSTFILVIVQVLLAGIHNYSSSSFVLNSWVAKCPTSMLAALNDIKDLGCPPNGLAQRPRSMATEISFALEILRSSLLGRRFIGDAEKSGHARGGERLSDCSSILLLPSALFANLLPGC